MTQFAQIQRAARLAPQLDKITAALIDHRIDGAEVAAWTTGDVLNALYAAGLKLDADLGLPGEVAQAQARLAAIRPMAADA